MNSPQHISGKVIGDIEVLRAIAVLFTVLQHIGLLLSWTHWEAGPLGRYVVLWGGVDLFFCISGFVIMRSLREECWRERGGFFHLALPFWIRRAWRILPTAWLWIALPLLAAACFNRSGFFGPFRANVNDALAAFFYFANIHWMNCNSAPAGDCNVVTSLLGPYWSLSLEEQFYFLLPFFISFLPKRIFVASILSLIFVQFLLSRPIWDPFWAVRTDALLLGVLIALWQGERSHGAAEPRLTRIFGRIPALALLVTLAGILLIATLPSPFAVLFCSTGLLALVCGVLVWLASYDRDFLLPAGRMRRMLIALGARSYSIYLIHLPVFVLTREIWFRLAPAGTVFGGKYSFRFLAMAALLLTVCVEANYRLVEKPLRSMGRRIAGRWERRLVR